MSEFVSEPKADKSGTTRNYTYKRDEDSIALYPAELAYDNKATSFRIYFVYDMETSGAKKEKVPVFEMMGKNGKPIVFELPEAEEDIQAIVRTMFMF